MTASSPTIAVVGGGPAGATFAAFFLNGWNQGSGRLQGKRPAAAPRLLIFEEQRGWEKPCGGGLTWKALTRYPFLGGASAPGNRSREMEVVVAGGQRIQFPLRKPIAVYSRRDLNELLLSRAEEAGAEAIEDRISRLEPADGGWHLEGLRAKYGADFVVVAAGVRTCLRGQLAGKLPSRDFMLTFGYYVRQADPLLRIELFRDFDGYAWSFPRTDHLSVGICGRASECTMPQLKTILHDFMRRHGYIRDGAPVFAHLLPSLGVPSWRGLRISGPGWALAGDAAGLVDPITGEGIYFAMRSGELLAESLLAELSGAVPPGPLNATSYEPAVRREIANALLLGARASRYFYHWNFLGEATTVRLLQLVRRSRGFMNLLHDMIEGTQTYDGLLHRIYREIPGALWQIATRPYQISKPSA